MVLFASLLNAMRASIVAGGLKKPIEWSLKTWLAPWSYVASIAFHDYYWLPVVGRGRVNNALNSPWGRLFHNWEWLTPDEGGWKDVGPAPASAAKRAG